MTLLIVCCLTLSDLERLIGVLVLFNAAISNLVGGYIDLCMCYHAESMDTGRFYSKITSPSADILPASSGPSSEVPLF